MISHLAIERFKSIKKLAFEPGRVNVFIGEPGTGKSNILEALGLFSFAYHGWNYKASDFIRFRGIEDLFYDRLVDKPFILQCDDFRLDLGFKNGSYTGQWLRGEKEIAQVHGPLRGPDLQVSASHGGLSADLGLVKLYRFQASRQLERAESDFLLPPYGDNLINLFLAHQDVFEEASIPFGRIGLELSMRLPEHVLELRKPLRRASIFYPYVLASDTFQRVTFYLAAIRTNRDSVLLLEEPEAHTFPHFTAALAEDIALDPNKNQYFITTHNPYFLLRLVEKTDKEDLKVFVTYLEEYETKVKELTRGELSRFDSIDPFWNLSRYVSKKRRAGRV